MNDREERDRWIRLFNRLDAAVSHHKRDKRDVFVDEVDEALYAARDKVTSDAGTHSCVCFHFSCPDEFCREGMTSRDDAAISRTPGDPDEPF